MGKNSKGGLKKGWISKIWEGGQTIEGWIFVGNNSKGEFGWEKIGRVGTIQRLSLALNHLVAKIRRVDFGRQILNNCV